jgi:hypothetical protein
MKHVQNAEHRAGHCSKPSVHGHAPDGIPSTRGLCTCLLSQVCACLLPVLLAACRDVYLPFMTWGLPTNFLMVRGAADCCFTVDFLALLTFTLTTLQAHASLAPLQHTSRTSLQSTNPKYTPTCSHKLISASGAVLIWLL